jgi:hypothetical protein
MIESVPALDLPAKQQLNLLRRLDRAHRWNSLKDWRRCSECGDVFQGSEIQIVGGTREHGPLRLQCPGWRCTAGPEAWRLLLDAPTAEKARALPTESAAGDKRLRARQASALHYFLTRLHLSPAHARSAGREA